ncbi:hypothetical protein PBI_CANTARE_4 [Brevibacterium phage Cantare]|uniref:Uncharacterized protein n=1 Tax=Brevibacterium phage Cantare TaxID=2338395 RepID=A0A3G3LYR0_9CAUD|nr:hypothetical protein PQD70_gp004 [Brevibacterium phage Cantare]AYQ99225.1 hypothetical protein PBI_CANTARE_4 [Brevibacterium phage Cantare]
MFVGRCSVTPKYSESRVMLGTVLSESRQVERCLLRLATNLVTNGYGRIRKLKKNHVIDPTQTLSDRMMEWFGKPIVIFAVWVLLFLLTLVYSELSFRALMSAFIAWVGGLVTSRLDNALRRERIYKDVSDKIARNRKFNRNVY